MHEPSSKTHTQSGRGPTMQTGMASAIAIAVEKPFGGSRDSMGDATRLHQSIIASGPPGTVYISLTIGFPSP